MTKVYFVYEGEPPQGEEIKGQRIGREAYKVKITLPAKWLEGPAEKLLTFFCDTYNKKFAEKPLVADEMALRCQGVDVPLTAIVQNCVEEYNDVFIVHAPKPREKKHVPEGSIVCTNFGCGQHYLPNQNPSDACRYHAKGPVFHDTFKYWACCPHAKVMDWAAFEKIEPCVLGPHSTANKPIDFSESDEVTNKALTKEEIDAQTSSMSTQGSPALQGADGAGEKRTCGPREFEGAVHDAQKPQEIKDGKATCRNFGCQQDFVVAENNANACRYHKSGPVFWDTYKYWGCCPDVKKIDFDDFVKIPGCCVGEHKL